MHTEPIWVGPKYATMEPNFEQAMSAVLGTSWDSVYADSAEIVGEQSKPLRARFAATNVHIAADTLGALAITQLTDALRAFTGENPADGSGADDDEWDSEVHYDDIPDDAWDEAPF